MIFTKFAQSVDLLLMFCNKSGMVFSFIYFFLKLTWYGLDWISSFAWRYLREMIVNTAFDKHHPGLRKSRIKQGGYLIYSTKWLHTLNIRKVGQTKRRLLLFVIFQPADYRYACLLSLCTDRFLCLKTYESHLRLITHPTYRYPILVGVSTQFLRLIGKICVLTHCISLYTYYLYVSRASRDSAKIST